MQIYVVTLLHKDHDGFIVDQRMGKDIDVIKQDIVDGLNHAGPYSMVKGDPFIDIDTMEDEEYSWDERHYEI